MALVSFASAKGSPGATTAAMLFAALWPRPSIVIEADPAGGDIALRMPGATGEPLDPNTGLSSLVAAGRRSLTPALIQTHSQAVVGGQQVVTGLLSSEQARGVTQWDQLGQLFADYRGADLMADLGRIGAISPQNALLDSSAAAILCVDTVPSNVIHLRERVSRLRERYGRVSGPAIHVMVIAPPNRTRAVREIAEALADAELHVADVHHLAWDPKGARFFLGQVVGNPGRTHLVRSAQPIVDSLASSLEPLFVPDAPESASGQEPVDPGEVSGTDAAQGSDR